MPIPAVAASVIPQIGLGVASLLESGANRRAARNSRSEYEKADAAIPLYDPEMLQLRGESQRRRRAFDAGTDPLTGYATRRIMQNEAMTEVNALRAGARGVGDLMRVQSNADQGTAALAVPAGRRADSAFAMDGDLTQVLSDRAYRRRMGDKRLIWNEYARQTEDANRQRMAGIGMLLGIGGSITGGDANVPMGGGAVGTMGSMSSQDPLGSLGYNSSQNYGFNYQPPSQNYGFNYQPPSPNYGFGYGG